MTINDWFKDEKLKYGIKRKAAKISALSSGKTLKYEYLTSEEILPSDQKIIDQAKFTLFSFRECFPKINRHNLTSREKTSWEALKDLKIEEQKAVEDKSDDEFSMQKETYFIKREN